MGGGKCCTMKFLSALYRRLDKSYSARHFDLSYRIDPDPWRVADKPYEHHKADTLVEVVARRRHKNAIDIGCGPGILTQRFAAHCDHILGIDFSSRAISLAKERCRDDKHVSFAVGDIRNLKLSTKYDLLICAEILYYMDPHDLDNTLDKIAELAAPDAWLLVLGFADDDPSLSTLKRRFKLLDYREDREWARPFAVSLFGLRDIQ